MNGYVDDFARSLLEIRVASNPSDETNSITAWVDTAFDGDLVLSGQLISELELDLLAETDAFLADGSVVTLKTFLCYVDWFERRRPVNVIANEGRFPLLGTGLLNGHVLQVDYLQKTLSET